jgi:hypothetical protein
MVAVLIYNLLYADSKRRRSEPGVLELMVAVDGMFSATVIWQIGHRFFS